MKVPETYLFAAVFGVLFFAAFVQAQLPDATSSEAVHRDALWDNYRIENEIRQSRQRQEGITIGSPQLPPQLADEKSDEKIFQLTDVVFEGTVRSISLRELNAIARRYISQEQVSLRDLYLMLTEIDDLFDSRNVVGRAVLPIQEVEDGVLYVQIIEGKVGRISVEGKREPLPILERGKKELVPVCRPLMNGFVRNQFHYRPGSVLNVKRLEEEILGFNRKFRTQLLAELEPGAELGQSDLKLTAITPQPVSFGYYCDNTGRESSGEHRDGMFVQLQNLLGADESFYCSYDETKGTSYLSLYGDAPISRYGTWFEMNYDYGSPETIYGPFASLNITGTSRRYRPALRQLLRSTKHRKTDVFFQVEHYESDTLFDGFLNYREKLLGYTFGLSDVCRTEKAFRMMSLSMQLGDSSVGGNPQAGDMVSSHYHLLQGSWIKALYPNDRWTFLAKAHGQLALSGLSQSRIFQIGGMATVRGVEEGLMTGDSGYFVNLEARRMLMNCREKWSLEGFTFFDHGSVFYRNYPPGYHRSDFLFSLGVGLNFTWKRHFSATVGYGEPIFTAESHQENYRESLRDGNAFFTLRVQY